MKIIASMIAALSLFSFSAGAQESKPAELKKENPKKISAAEAEKHFNETVIVTGKVAQVSIREKIVYLNLDKPYPDSPFTGVIFARATNQFGDLKALKGKEVEIKGKIAEYRDKAQIVLDSTNQLSIIGEGAGTKAAEKK
jgi:DNA/RNA endonuclease YhcR with UshA esterase domain